MNFQVIHWRNIELWKSWVRWRTFSSIHKLKRGSGEVVDTPPPSPIHGSCESLQSLDSRILQQSEEDIESEGLDQEEGESLEDPSFDDLTVIDLFSSSSQIKLGGPHEMVCLITSNLPLNFLSAFREGFFRLLEFYYLKKK